MARRTLDPTSDAFLVSRRIACKDVDEEKPYHRLEKCAQNGVHRLGVSVSFLPCEYCLVKCDEYNLVFEELC